MEIPASVKATVIAVIEKILTDVLREDSGKHGDVAAVIDSLADTLPVQESSQYKSVTSVAAVQRAFRIEVARFKASHDVGDAPGIARKEEGMADVSKLERSANRLRKAVKECGDNTSHPVVQRGVQLLEEADAVL
eukprot:2543624-Pyramimonas_sp.AAC.1